MAATESKFINRELSWLEFNARVLSEGLNPDVPLLERLKFLCIVHSNLDEFYMVRVASVKRQIREGDRVRCPSGIRPSALLTEITNRVRDMTESAGSSFTNDLLPALAAEGLTLAGPEDASDECAEFMRTLFHEQVFPVLTPVRVIEGEEFPYTANLRLHAAFLVRRDKASAVLAAEESSDHESLVILQIPPSLDRLVALPNQEGCSAFALLEDIVASFAPSLFPGCAVKEHCLFRVTRDADLGVDEERDEDFMEAMRDVLTDREHSRPVRLTVSDNSGSLTSRLTAALGIPEAEVFVQTGPMDLGGLMGLAMMRGQEKLRYKPWKPTRSPLLPEEESPFAVLRKRDVLLHHPYEQFDPVVTLLQEAAVDPSVLSVKITLYRTSGDSPVVRALEQAARNGKQVTAVVELKARFDEQRNIDWATRLQRAGVIVVYGVAHLKVHAKALLIVRREPEGVVRYAHLGTGNYNDKTARLYTDFGLLTSRSDLVYELGLFFNAITGYSAIPTLQKLSMAPVSLKPRLLQLIERETLRSESGESGLIMAKLNSLADPDVIKALYNASAAGVVVKLNVRGICMLRPGVKGLSENITVVSVIDRYLEHGRVFYFENGGAPDLYCSSADWMPRNLERRVELMFPIEDEEARARIVSSVEAAFRDNRRAHLVGPDGRSRRVKAGKGVPAFESQHHLQKQAEARVGGALGDDNRTFEVRRLPPEV